jgi:anti-sigma regulatory factor (Ser/Thr protein kinase)
MITKEELIEHGYDLLPQGGWVRLNPEIIPRDWEDICKDFGVDPSCHEIILAVCGVKEISEGINEEV